MSARNPLRLLHKPVIASATTMSIQIARLSDKTMTSVAKTRYGMRQAARSTTLKATKIEQIPSRKIGEAS